MSPTKPGFSVRIVVCDYYLTKPIPGIDVIYSEFRGSDIKQVPVLRIFGAAHDGYKTCLHIHGVFPYFYIPCPTPNPEPQFLYQIAASLDKALNIAVKQATSTNQHVYRITLVKGLPFYGFHDKEHLYLKVFLYNPGLIKQAVELCSNGAILGQAFQPHESHLNFTLQFFIDFNLFGMSNIDLQTVHFRKKTTSQSSEDPLDSPQEFAKTESMCYYEADCIASHIINRQRIGRGDGIENPGLEEVWKQEKERRKQLNMSMASKSLSQGRLKAEETDTHYKYEQMCLIKLSGLVDKPVITDNVPIEEVYYPAESLEGSQLFSAVDVSMHLPEKSLSYSFNATLKPEIYETMIDDADATLVDENIALNSTLVQYSLVSLDNEDMDFLDVLKDMDADPVEEDSIMATPASKKDGDDDHSSDVDDDIEYSQIFHDETLPILTQSSKDSCSECSWNDSFWNGANIPQLDGTFDDDHVKKVRKRKMRPFKLGLSRPKSKKKLENTKEHDKEENLANLELEEINSKSRDKYTQGEEIMEGDSETDEINESRVTVDNISNFHLKKSIKTEPNSVLDYRDETLVDEESESSITQLVEKALKKYEKLEPDTKYHKQNNHKPVADVSVKIGLPKPKITDGMMGNKNDDEINESRITIQNVSDYHLKKRVKTEPNSVLDFREGDSADNADESITQLVEKAFANTEKLEPYQSYDKKNNFQPVAGTSTFKAPDSTNHEMDISDSWESSPDTQDLGLISFYDISKVFNASRDVDLEDLKENKEKLVQECGQVDENKIIVSKKEDLDADFITDDIKLRYSDSPQDKMPLNISKKQNENTVILTPKFRPPTSSYIEGTLEKYNIPKNKFPKPFYSNYKDVGDKVEIGQIILKVQSKLAHDQKPFEKVLDTTSIEEWRQLLFLQTNESESESNSKPEQLKTLLAGNKMCILTPVLKPPTTRDVQCWNKAKTIDEKPSLDHTEVVPDKDLDSSQAIGLNEEEINSSISLESEEKKKANINDSLHVTMQPDGSFLCFGNGESQKEVAESPVAEMNFLTIMVIELHTEVRGELNPDPMYDQIQAVFIKITNDCPEDHFLQKSITEIIVVDSMPSPQYLDRCVFIPSITYVNNESEIIQRVIEIIQKHDPDIMCGYEMELNSWGYFLERSEVLGLDIVMEVSRITDKYRQRRWKRDEHDYEGRIIGRVLFNVWRLFRHELALSSYSFENCMFEVLKERVPAYSPTQLAEWWADESRILRWIPVEYYLTRLSGTVRMLEKLDIINRTAELARLFGLQWWEVLSRGSQFRVESLMLRAARPLNLVALSPTVKQRAAMRAPECLPLIFEPESRFYSDPVIVLDFQSLYPSMMIAYNYCFSTCIGRVQNISGDAAYEFGAWRLRISKSKLEKLVRSGLVHWSPVGVGFVKPIVRRGVLPALLRRILAARQAVKKSMKMQTDEAVKKAMHSRQLGLKLIANVTYGYTAANFSGRMPCVEVGDSVVAKGRETLQRAIDLVHSNKAWNAKVVYGDTDSMFVLIPGGSRAEAFLIGQQIADAVTADNPSPVALKLEKVYQPCILQTKKRYVGYMYESADQDKPVYEAKGIETVRRDGCPAGVKLLQRTLCELFDTADMSRVKRVVMATLSKMADGTLPVHELFFTREYHGPNGYRPGASAPPNEIAKRASSRDRRSCPRAGSRVSWLVSAGAPSLPLLKLAKSPAELLRESAPRPLVAYYVTRVLLPPVHRCLSLLGVNVFAWWSELGYTRDIQHIHATSGGIGRYLWRERCALCGQRSTRSICANCSEKPIESVATVAARLRLATSHVEACKIICDSCVGHTHSDRCANTECPVQWRRHTAKQKLSEIQDIVRQMPPHMKCSESIDF